MLTRSQEHLCQLRGRPCPHARQSDGVPGGGELGVAPTRAGLYSDSRRTNLATVGSTNLSKSE